MGVQALQLKLLKPRFAARCVLAALRTSSERHDLRAVEAGPSLGSSSQCIYIYIHICIHMRKCVCVCVYGFVGTVGQTPEAKGGSGNSKLSGQDFRSLGSTLSLSLSYLCYVHSDSKHCHFFSLFQICTRIFGLRGA